MAGAPPGNGHRPHLLFVSLVCAFVFASTPAPRFPLHAIAGSGPETIPANGTAGVPPGPPSNFSDRVISSSSGVAHGSVAPTAAARYLLGQRIDVNSATPEEIDSLPGISGKVAAALVRERKRRGTPFRSARELLSVPGIKEKRLSKILPFLSPFPDNN